MPDLLLELRSEDIPAAAQARACADLERLLTKALEEAGIAASSLQSYSTPRRLAVTAKGIPVVREKWSEERRGPRADAPDRAVEGFLRSTGLERNALESRETSKGIFLFTAVEHPAAPATEILAALVPKVIQSTPWQKSMRWGSGEFRWVRPLQGILCILDSKVIDFEVGGIRSGKVTCGHRFLAPSEIEIPFAADYEEKLAKVRVIANPEDRRERILTTGRAVAKKAGMRFEPDEPLLREVSALVEWPVALVGNFEKSFLDLPTEVLTTTMRHHQKYFPLTKTDGSLAPAFLVVADIDASDEGDAIRQGNERVLRARLADAAFFWERDRSLSLAERIPDLSDIVFHTKLGSMEDKAKRLSTLAGELASFIPDLKPALAKKTALLAKADLATGLVDEFPELQGIVGGHLARVEGMIESMATAIGSHFAPAGPDDSCPSEPLSIAVALADKLDTLTGFFAAGERPTGSGDPFALRRAALGVIRIVLETRLRLPLRKAFAVAHGLYPNDKELTPASETSTALKDFFLDRLRVHLRSKGVRHDYVSAVLSTGDDDDLYRLVTRAGALGVFLESESGSDLLAVYRRATGILAIEEKRDGAPIRGTPDPKAVVEKGEVTLLKALDSAEPKIGEALDKEDYAEAMKALATLRNAVDVFFEEVRVNLDDKALRANRLRLLFRLRTVFDRVADLSRIEGA